MLIVALEKQIMLTAMLVLLIRLYKKTHPGAFDFFKLKIIKRPAIVLVFLLTVLSAFTQEKKYNYCISVGGKSVGELSVKKKESSDSLMLDINSAISTRMIFLFTAIAAEKSIFQNGRLRYSFITRQVNKGRLTTMETKDMGLVYHSQKKGEAIRVSNSPIHHNMSSLYLIEPVNFGIVYSDMFQEFVKIIFVGLHHYKIILPDGNYNEYFYADGICKRIRVHQTLFTAQMDLKSINQL
jgi:hypothetical protein